MVREYVSDGRPVIETTGGADPEGGRQAVQLVAGDGALASSAETETVIAMRKSMDEMLAGMRAMAEMLRVTNERMAAMEKTIRTLEKITPQQAVNVGKCVRDRAAELCREYRMGVTVTPVEPGKGSRTDAARFEPNEAKKKELSAEIRKALREMTGARSMREISRIDYETVIAFVMDWEDYDAIQRIRKAGRAGI